jgi:hypothetical protein
VGNLDTAREVFHKGLTTPTMFMRLEKPRMLVGSARLALAEGQPQAAADFVAQARAFAVERKMKQVLPLIDLAEGDAQAALGQPAAALEAFERAEAQAAAMGMRPMTWKAQAGAARALDALKRPDEAGAKRQRAQVMVEEIAGLFEDADLRQQFTEEAMERIRGAVAVI